MDTLLSTPAAAQRFKQALSADLCLENILFYEEADRFRKYVMQASQHIFDTFLREGALSKLSFIEPSQVRLGA